MFYISFINLQSISTISRQLKFQTRYKSCLLVLQKNQTEKKKNKQRMDTIYKMLNSLGKNSADHILVYVFFIFFQKIGFDRDNLLEMSKPIALEKYLVCRLPNLPRE